MTKNALFFWIPKTAGTSIHETIRTLTPMPKLKLPEQWPKFCNQGLVTFAHVSVNQLRAKNYILDDFYYSAFKFTFVRNPFDRAVSLYHYLIKDKIVRKGTPFKKFLKMVKKGVPPIGLYNVKGMSQANPQHCWLPEYYDNVTGSMDYIGRFENLQQDFNEVLRTLGLPETEILKKRVSKGRDKTVKYYNDETADLVRQIYKMDFVLYGYDMEESK